MRLTREFSDRHGGLSAWLRNRWLVQADRFDGRLARYRLSPPLRADRILFACWGNICRSAYAAGRWRLMGHACESFGLRTHSGKSADPVAIRVAAERGVDLGDHRTRRPEDLTLGEGDLILGMEPEQLRQLAGQPGRGALLGLLHPDEPRALLFDPFGREPASFRHCFGYIDACLLALERRLQSG